MVDGLFGRGRYMADVMTIYLKGDIPKSFSVEFLRAQISTKYSLPLVLIWYSVMGREQESGLRLDLDKKTFLDHFEDAEMEETARRAAPAIVSFLGSTLQTQYSR
jgi:hypothetical protein